MVEQAGGGTGEQVLNPAAGGPGAIPGLVLVRRPRANLRRVRTRAASGPALAVLRPVCEVLAGGPA